MNLNSVKVIIELQGPRIHAPPDFYNPKQLWHKNAIKLEFSEKWGKIWLLAPPLTFRVREAPVELRNAQTSDG